MERSSRKVLLPTPAVGRHVRRLASEVGADLVVLDPAFPLGLIGPGLGLPYVVVVHGAEVSVPARLPVTAALVRRVLLGATHVVAAGQWVLDECNRVAGRQLPATVVPPGVDTGRFRPLAVAEREAARDAFGIPAGATAVVGLGRLVPRKGMDVLIAAASLLAPVRPGLVVAIAGSGRDEARLRRLVHHTGAPVRFLGTVPEADKPSLLGAADVVAVPCRKRWRGLEQEGFGIVFVEAAACGVPQVAGDSGGVAEAVEHGSTGLVVRHPGDPVAVAAALAKLLDDEPLRRRLGAAARDRAVARLDYDRLASSLGASLQMVRQ